MQVLDDELALTLYSGRIDLPNNKTRKTLNVQRLVDKEFSLIQLRSYT